MITSIGGSPVNTLEDSGNVDVINSLSILDRVSRQVQSKGWDYNTFTLSIQGDILNNYEVLWDDSWLTWEPKTYIKRNGKLYDKTNDTYQFENPININAIIGLNFEDLPEVFKTYITIKAAILFQTTYMGDATVIQGLQQELQLASQDIVGYDMSMDDYNMLQLTGIASNLARS